VRSQRPRASGWYTGPLAVHRWHRAIQRVHVAFHHLQHSVPRTQARTRIPGGLPGWGLPVLPLSHSAPGRRSDSVPPGLSPDHVPPVAGAGPGPRPRPLGSCLWAFLHVQARAAAAAAGASNSRPARGRLRAMLAARVAMAASATRSGDSEPGGRCQWDSPGPQGLAGGALPASFFLFKGHYTLAQLGRPRGGGHLS
jgi:hypothetical protein